MRYANVFISGFGYQLPPNVVSSTELEERLKPVYDRLHLRPGQLEALTGVRERRYWDPGFKMSRGATRAADKALTAAGVSPSQVDLLIYAGVCRDQLEPATACAVAQAVGIGPQAQVYDLSNACLGVVSGMIHAANAIDMGQIRAGLVVSCETARDIVDITIERMLQDPSMETFKNTIATLTGGSGAVAVLLTAAGFEPHGPRHQLVGGVARNAVAHHRLCTWGPDTGMPATRPHVMNTDSVGVLRHGVDLGVDTYAAFRQAVPWPGGQPDKVICHQVGAAHQRTVLERIGISPDKDFATFQYLGNIGTVSLPITAAIAAERGFLAAGDRVGFFGIGSGLNCLLLGIEW
jgi:3-oxoacyl-[acyl-carrier-protein] synthase III